MYAFIRFIKLDIWTKRICLLGAFLLIGKLLFLLFSDIHIHAIEDWYIAQNLSDGKGYTIHDHDTALKTPIYPLFLTFFAMLPDVTGTLLASASQHILLFITNILLMWALTLQYGRKYGNIIGLLFLVHPAYFYYPFILESTALTVPLSVLYLFIVMQYVYERTKVNNWLRYSIGWILALCQPIFFPIICISMIVKRKSDSYVSLLFPIIISFMIVFSPWIYRNKLVFDSIVVFKSPFWMNIYEGFYPSNGIASKYISKENQTTIDSLRNMYNDVKMEQYYKPIVMNTIVDYPAEYVMLSIDRFKQFWTIPHRYDNKIFSFSIFISRIIPQFLLTIGVLLSTLVLIKYRERHNFSTIYVHTFLLISILYVSIIYSLTQSSNIRFKLDIEWIELLLLYPLFEYISVDILKKKNPRLN
jgi:hypothetical protein